MITLRPYQEECVERAQFSLAQNTTSLVVMATGLGKTTVAAELISRYERSLFIAHRKELIEQGQERVAEYTGRAVGVEMAGSHANGEDIIVASVQTLHARPQALDGWKPDLIIVDEAHHAVSPTYQDVLGRYPGVKLLGVTATADRSDGAALGRMFNHVAYRYETPQAIRDGWLAPIKKRRIGFGALQGAVESRKTIVFTPTVAEAIQVAYALPRSTFVHGELPKEVRTRRIQAFKSGEYQYMVNCNILTEGFDAPDIECVAMLRATESRSVFVQCLGRGLRIAPGKIDCLYLDLVDMPDHSLQGPRDALAGN